MKQILPDFKQISLTNMIVNSAWCYYGGKYRRFSKFLLLVWWQPNTNRIL